MLDASASEGDNTAPAPRSTIKVGIADHAVTQNGALLSTSGVGSCLVITLYDDRSGIAGLIHAMLPYAAESSTNNPAKFTDTGTVLLYNDLLDAGASAEHVTAKIAGGSRMLSFSEEELPIGDRNVASATAALDRLDVPIVAEDVGGDRGRSLRFDPHTGNLVVRRANEGTTTI